jgi:signal transduction histidine kinase
LWELKVVLLDEQFRVRRPVAVGRTVVAACVLGMFVVSPSQTSTASLVLAGWLALAFFSLRLLRLDPHRQATFALAIHAVDVLVAVSVALLTGSSATPGFALLLFALLAAAYQWGFAGAVVTACVSALLLGLEPVIGGMSGAAFVPRLENGDVLVRSACVLLAGVVTGYLTHGEQRLRAEATSIAAIVSRVDVRAGLTRTMTSMFDSIFPLFEARRALLLVHEKATDRIYVWAADRAADGRLPAVRSSLLNRADLSTYMFAPEAAAWHAARRGRSTADRWDVVAVDEDGSRISPKPWSFPATFIETMNPCDRLMAVRVELGDEWSGRLFLIDPGVGADRHAALVFARRVVLQVVPAIHNVYLLHRVKAQARASERARIARELHDGVIQTVTGVQMHIAALSRQLAKGSSPEVAGDLRQLEVTLQEEVVRLRELMTEIKPIDLGPDQLVDALADFVQRFQRETGIAARFVTQLDRIALAPHACGEIARIVQEALFNVRRHSGARHVFVRLSAVNGDCRLSIDNDGRGFPFRGRMTQAELTATRNGPHVIGERVRLLGGALTVESDPGRGARLEIAVPLSPHAINS